MDVNKEIHKHLAVLVYLSHEKCNVCQVLKPKVTELLQSEFPHMKMVSVDTENQPKIAAQLSVFAAPTVILFFEGKESKRFSRNFGLIELHAAIKRYYELLNFS